MYRNSSQGPDQQIKVRSQSDASATMKQGGSQNPRPVKVKVPVA